MDGQEGPQRLDPGGHGRTKRSEEGRRGFGGRVGYGSGTGRVVGRRALWMRGTPETRSV